MQLPRELVAALRKVRSVGVITGAGVSAESGLQTYRGQGGLYDDAEEGEQTVEALTGTTLARDPERTWRALLKMARQAKDARPNAAHDALVAIERAVERFVLLTQNVDGLHEEAGSRNVIAIHGTLAKSRCMDCGTKGTFTRAEFAALTEAPRCYTCGGYLRPEVVLFGEMLPLAETARLHREFAVEIPDLVLSVGTSALFPYIQQPARIAREAGKLTVEINPERTEISALVDYSLQGRAGELLPLVADVFG